VLDAQRRLRQQQASAERQRLLLTYTVGIGAATPFELDTAIPDIFDPSTLDPDALVARAAEVHPLLRQADASLATARARSAAARGTRWPRISASFNFSRSAQRPGHEAFGDVNPLNRGWGTGLNFSLPIFKGFGPSHEIEQADAAERDTQHERRRIGLQVEQEIRSALVDLETAYDELELVNQIAALTEERLTMAEEQYRIGALDFLLLQQLIDDNLAAQRQAVDAQFTFITARAALEEKLGGPIQP
jgi:outer membrane protein TolC